MRGMATLTMACVAMAAVGCAGPSGSARALPVAEDAERVVEFWYMPNGPDPAAHLESEAERFRAEHPDIRIDLVELTWESALTRIITAATSGSGPDALQIGTTWVPGIAELGGLRELTEEDLDSFGGRDAFVAPSWTSTAVRGDGATVAVPWFLDTRAGFYRTDVFADLGLDPATAFRDWEAFEATLQAIKDDGGIAPLAVSGANDFNVVHDLAPWVWAAGGDFLSDDASAPAIVDPPAVAGVHRYQRLVATYNHPRALAMGVEDAQELFIAGEAAMTIGDASVLSDLRSADAQVDGAGADWATFALPRGPAGRHAFLGGSNLAVFANAQQPEAALAWVRFLSSEASQLRYADAIGMLPARSGALQDDRLQGDEAVAPFVVQLRDGRQYPAIGAWLHVEVALQHHFGRMWQEVDASGALEQGEVRARLRQAAADVEQALAGDD